MADSRRLVASRHRVALPLRNPHLQECSRLELHVSPLVGEGCRIAPARATRHRDVAQRARLLIEPVCHRHAVRRIRHRRIAVNAKLALVVGIPPMIVTLAGRVLPPFCLCLIERHANARSLAVVRRLHLGHGHRTAQRRSAGKFRAIRCLHSALQPRLHHLTRLRGLGVERMIQPGRSARQSGRPCSIRLALGIGSRHGAC